MRLEWPRTNSRLVKGMRPFLTSDTHVLRDHFASRLCNLNGLQRPSGQNCWLKHRALLDVLVQLCGDRLRAIFAALGNLLQRNTRAYTEIRSKNVCTKIAHRLVRLDRRETSDRKDMAHLGALNIPLLQERQKLPPQAQRIARFGCTQVWRTCCCLSIQFSVRSLLYFRRCMPPPSNCEP